MFIAKKKKQTEQTLKSYSIHKYKVILWQTLFSGYRLKYAAKAGILE